MPTTHTHVPQVGDRIGLLIHGRVRPGRVATRGPSFFVAGVVWAPPLPAQVRFVRVTLSRGRWSPPYLAMPR